MASIFGCVKADEADLAGQLTPVIGVGDEEDTVAELIEWPRLKGSRVKYSIGSSRFREFCKAKSSIDGIWGHAFVYRAQFDYGLTLPLSNLAKSVMNLIGAFSAQLNCNFWEVIPVCETLNGRWAASCSERRITAKDFLKYYATKYRSDEEPLELNNRTITKGINCKVSRKESFIDVVAREGTELEAVLKELEISSFKMVASKDDKVRRSQAKRRLAGKTLGSMEEKLSTPELNTPLKLAWLNKIMDGPVDMATVSSTVVRNLAKRKAIKRGLLLVLLRRSVWTIAVRGGSHLEEQCRAKAREKMVVVMDDEFKKFARALRDVQLGFQDRSMELEKRISQLEGEKNQLKENLTRERGAFQLEWEKEREAAALKLKEVRAESEAEAERLVTASAISRNNLEAEEMEDGLNVAEKTAANNQETIKQKELDVAREKEEQTLLYNVEYAEEYEVLFSQYEDQLDDNVKLSLKLEEAKRQVEEKTAIILSRDLALNLLTNELVELKEKTASDSRHEAGLAEYRVRALNEKISDMECNLRALNEQLLKRGIKLDTARTNLAVSETDFEKLSSSIMGKD
ncbi:hypothetical protein GIB67_034539 [Kingdonia uniflora]|uniref:Uncharacterized protein n=1 Tax=Kingdonia uniflora TaxID=39325 RepID=A0A7J7PB73_9MAGN|nr:hypothetical protein GIB67_034539 [Kingdonia uniflora]